MVQVSAPPHKRSTLAWPRRGHQRTARARRVVPPTSAAETATGTAWVVLSVSDHPPHAAAGDVPAAGAEQAASSLRDVVLLLPSQQVRDLTSQLFTNLAFRATGEASGDSALVQRLNRVWASRGRLLTLPRARELAARAPEIHEVLFTRALQYRDQPEAAVRALLSLYAENQLTEGEIRRLANWSHWDFLDALGRHPDLAPRHDDFLQALGALDQH